MALLPVFLADVEVMRAEQKQRQQEACERLRCLEKRSDQMKRQADEMVAKLDGAPEPHGRSDAGDRDDDMGNVDICSDARDNPTPASDPDPDSGNRP